MPKFTKRHYEAFAKMMASERPVPALPRHVVAFGAGDWGDGEDRKWHDIVDAMADTFASDNPRFDREKFLTAAEYYL